MKPTDAIPILADKLREGKLILFVGAGLSRGSGLPDWKTLFAPLCKKLDRPYEDDFPAVADELIAKGIFNRNDLVEYIVKKIGAVELELNENHRLLKELPFKIIITTNYDNLLEDLYGASKLKRIYLDEEMAYFDPQSTKTQLIYLHGDINHARHMVISDTDYQGYAHTHKLMARRLELLLQEYTVLFTGYSAADPNLLAVFDHFRITYKEDAKRHFIVIVEPPEKKVNRLRHRYGIEPVILDRHRELTAFLQGFVDVYKNPGQKVPIALSEADEDFISPETIKARGEEFFEKEQQKYRIPLDFKPKKPFTIPTEDPHFTGRETEIALLKKALLEKQTVGVTGLFGMGGIGKTSLSKHVAHMLKREGHFKDGILWHRLEANPLSLSLEELADAFGAYFLKEMPKMEVKTRYFQSIIQDLDILVILDNAEYLENIPPLLELLSNHPVLITSRRQLGGLAEVIDIDRLDEEKAAELFIKTRQREDKEEKVKKIIAALPDRERKALHNICSRLLGGLPLAITIAASVLHFRQSDLLSFEKILNDKKLDLLKDPNNVFKSEAKDRDVRLSFDLSFSQAEVKETTRSIFSVLGIFGGEDFSKDALYEIFKEDKNEEIDKAVAQLIQLSLMQTRENRRLCLHPLLRQYALEKLPEFMGDVAYEKLAAYYVDLVKNNPRALAYEWKNGLFVADWCLTHSKEKDGLFLIQKIDWFLYGAGKWGEREGWLKKGSGIADRIEDISYYYKFNSQLEDLYSRQGRYKEEVDVINKLSAYCSRFPDLKSNISWLNYALANSFLQINLPEKACNLNLKNLKACIFFNEEEATGAVYRNLGDLFKRSGSFNQAMQFCKAALNVLEKFGSRENKVRAIGDIGDLYLDLERYAEALAWYKRFESEAKECENKELEAGIYLNYFFYYLNTGYPEKAGDYLKKYRETIDEFGEVTTPAFLNYCEGLLEKAKKDYHKAIDLLKKAVQFYNDIEREGKKGKCYFTIGNCYLKLGNIRQARKNLDAAGAIFKEYETSPISRCELEACLGLLEAKSAYDQRAVRLLNRAKNTLRKIGIEDAAGVKEIEAEIRRETGEEKYDTLLNQLQQSKNADETIDLGGDYLFMDPQEKEITSPIDGRDMALIPAGFAESESCDYPLYFYPFYMDKYPVTNRGYKKFIEDRDVAPPLHWQDGKIPPGSADHPVVGITYDDALAYAQWAGKDLPLQEEWEVAAGNGEGASFPWGQKAEDNQEYFKPPLSEEGKGKAGRDVIQAEIAIEKTKQEKLLNDSPENIKTYPVQRFAKNRSRHGIYDLLGNVFEYTSSFTIPGQDGSPLVLKGFSWLRYAKENKDDIGGREYSLAHQRWADVGFRCVKRIFRKGEEKEFIETGARAKDWQGDWFYNRAQHLFAGLSSDYFLEDRGKSTQAGAMFCRQALECSPAHKQAAYLLIRFQFIAPNKKETDYKNIYDHSLCPMLEKNSHSATFNWRRVEELFPPLKEAGAMDNMVAKRDRLKEISGRIDALLQAVENTLVIDRLRLAERNTIASMDYLLKRHEEDLSFFHYLLILFLCSLKIDIAAHIAALEKISEIGLDLVTPEIKKGKDSIAALKITNLGLAPLKDIFVELSVVKPPQKQAEKTIILEQKEFKIPLLARGESRVLETTVNTKKTGAFPLYITLFYTNPKVGKGKQDSQQIIEKQIKVVSAAEKAAPPEIAFGNPYLTGRPVQSPEMFFGRRDVLARIEKRLSANNIIILYGQRRTGKTSTLFQLKNVVYKKNAIPVFLTMQSMLGSDRNFFFFKMAEGVYEGVKNRSQLPEPKIADYKTNPQYKLERFLKAVLQQVKDIPIIYLIDEFDGLFRMITDKKMEPAVLDNLRSIMQHFQQVWFLLAGTHLLKNEAADYDSALFNIATYEKISTLDEKDAGELITEPVRGRVEYEPYAVEKIKTLTNCHPYFIQGICFELMNYLETEKLTRVTAKEVDAVVNEILGKGNTHFDHYWPYLRAEEQLFLSLLAENLREYESFASIDRIKDFCKGWFKPGADIYKLIDHLKEKELISEKKYMDSRHTGFFMDIFRRWVRMYHPPEPLSTPRRGEP